MPSLARFLAFSLVGLPLPSASARAAIFVFQPFLYLFGATGPASGILITAGGTGGPGEQIQLADIVSSEFSHTFDAHLFRYDIQRMEKT